MRNPVRVAFCPLLFKHNGGQFKNGKPVLEPTRSGYIRGRCDAPYDCGECPLLSAFLHKKQQDGYTIGWECTTCVVETKKIPRELPGYYQSGRLRESPTETLLVDEDRPLDGCTRCGKGTSLLQAVLRRK